jgi:Protein of unknown function (DUF3306)
VAEPDAFLTRWSRLKRRAQGEACAGGACSGKARPAVDAATRPSDSPARSAHDAPDAQPQIDKPQARALPSIETLGKDSDYTPFMRADVPDALRNAALRKLWQSDPVFANLDGLVDYAEDFGAGFALGGAVATVYRVLDGMPDPLEETPPQPADSAPSTEPNRDDGVAAATVGTTGNSRLRDGTRECELDELIESHDHIDLD